MGEEFESPSSKKHRRAEKRRKENESTIGPEAVDEKSESTPKKQNKGSKKDSEPTTSKSKTGIADKIDLLMEDDLMPNNESSSEPLLEDQSVATMNQVIARIGQLESHLAVLTNSVAELQRNHSKMHKQLKTIEKHWSAVREAWAGQSNVSKSSNSHKKKKSSLERHSKKKKMPKKNKCKKEKKKEKLLNTDVAASSDISSSATPPPPQLPDTIENCSGSGEQDLTKRIRSVLKSIFHELPTPKK